jgi:hypothetical protein
MQNTVAELERYNLELQLALDSSTNLNYIALGIAIVAIIVEIMMASKRLCS